MACRRKIPCAVCRLPIVDGKDEAILCEGSCQQWYHRGCASLPPERYKELSSTDEPFFCLTCTCLAFKKEMSALSSTVTNLRQELQAALRMRESISALENEVYLLKESLKDAKNQLERAKQPRPTLQPRSFAATTKLNKASGAVKAITTQRTGTNEKAASNRAENASAPQSKLRKDNAQQVPTGKCKVVGARRIWGPFYFCSPNAVLGCIKKLTGIDAKLRARKKTKDLANNKTIWWFVLHGDEKDLCTLDEEWDKVHLQTSWRLESCFAPLTTGDTASPNNSPANPAEHDPNHPSPSIGTTSAVAATTSKDVNTTLTAKEPHTPATTLPSSTDPSQSSINHLNHSNQSDSTSMMHETSINHLNRNDSVEDETTRA